MKIAVLVKQVPGPESPLPLVSNEDWLDESQVAYIMNESDNYALEEALQIREKNNGGEVVVVSLGPDRTQKVIREALSKGADRGIHIQSQDKYPTDPLLAGSLFAETLKEENFDIIFSGLQSDDLGYGQTGIILGELLGMSTATLAMSTEIINNKIKVKRELEAGYFQWVTMSLPASISVQSGCNTPRYPSLKGIMGAKKKEIHVVTPSVKDQNQSIKKIYAPSSAKETVMIEGSVDQVVEKLVTVFRNEIKIA